jgi:SOS-response transcriptional repressor LexA
MQKAGKTNQSALAREVGIKPQSIQYLANPANGARGSEHSTKLGSALRVNSHWLSTGEGGPEVAEENVAPARANKRVPLISWVRAGMWGDVSDNFHPGEADEWIEVYDTVPGDQAFCLYVMGDSMTSPYPGDQVTFPDGTVILVDPARSAGAGDFVVAKDVGTQKATFKKLTTDGGRWFLKPLNPSYPAIEIDDPDMRVIGKVTQSITRRKY